MAVRDLCILVSRWCW